MLALSRELEIDMRFRLSLYGLYSRMNFFLSGFLASLTKSILKPKSYTLERGRTIYLGRAISSVCSLQMSSNVVMLLAIVGVALRIKRWRCEVEQQSRPTWSIQWICCRANK